MLTGPVQLGPTPEAGEVRLPLFPATFLSSLRDSFGGVQLGKFVRTASIRMVVGRETAFAPVNHSGTISLNPEQSL
jgi:hypothetical protein